MYLMQAKDTSEIQIEEFSKFCQHIKYFSFYPAPIHWTKWEPQFQTWGLSLKMPKYSSKCTTIYSNCIRIILNFWSWRWQWHYGNYIFKEDIIIIINFWNLWRIIISQFQGTFGRWFCSFRFKQKGT